MKPPARPLASDLRRELEPVAPPLPAGAKVLVHLFYFANAALILAAGAFYGLGLWTSQRADEQQRQADQIQLELVGATAELQKLLRDEATAQRLTGWLRTTHPVQPLLVELTRDLPQNVFYERIQLLAQEDQAVVRLTVQIQGDALGLRRQIVRIQDVMQARGYTLVTIVAEAPLTNGVRMEMLYRLPALDHYTTASHRPAS